MVNIDYGLQLEEDTHTAYRKQSKQQEDLTSELTVLLLFMASTAIFSAIPLGNLQIAINQRMRYQARTAMDGAEGPWSFSPKGYMESNMVKMALDLLKEEGYSLRDLSKTAKTTMTDDSFNFMKNNLERQGQWSYHETTMQGQMSEYMVYDVRMIWRTCEDNGNCMTESPVCADCEANSGVEFTVNEFPSSHDFCRCNEPEIEVYVVERFRENLL